MTPWRKKGLIYSPTDNWTWARTHCHVPTVEVIDDAVVRVYFAALDPAQYGRIGYVDLDIDDPSRVVRVAQDPVLDLGPLGTFDDCGVVPSCLISWKKQRLLYYIGFQRTHRVPYMLFTGMASATSADKFRRYSSTPVLDRSPTEPFSRSAPFVRVENDLLRMWYWSCTGWVTEGDVPHYRNVIRHATSEDGVNWQVDEHICLEPNLPDEYSIGRPCVVWQEGRYRMWYSTRSFSRFYSIGYAESVDGIVWERMDELAGIVKSESGWDSEMVCYPFVIEIKGRLHMFYNGNGHGASGFGLAVQES